MIKLNQPKFESAIRLLKENPKGFVVFLGAGASKAAGLPLWGELVEKLRIDCESVASADPDNTSRAATLRKLQAIKDEKNLWRSLDSVKSILKHTTFNERVRFHLQHETTEIPTRYELLWKLGVGGFVNFNLDSICKDSFSKAHGKSPLTATYKEVEIYRNFLTSNRPFIFQIHGTCDDPENWLLTSGDRQRHLSYLSKSNEFIQLVLNSRNTLFVGFNPDDIAFQVAQEMSMSSLGRLGNNHFILAPRPSESFIEEYEGKGFTVLDYYPQNDQKQSEIEEFLEEVTGTPSVEPSAFSALELSQLSTLSGFDDQDTEQAKINSLRVKLNRDVCGILGIHKDASKEQSTALLSYYSENLKEIHESWLVKPNHKFSWIFHYKTDQQLGRGAFGTVYRASDTRNGDVVAIKILLENVIDSTEFLSTFRRGVRSMRILGEHNLPGMVRFREAYEIPACIVMDYIPGMTLRDAIMSKTLSLEERIGIVAKIGQIVQQGHRLDESVLHRDLKPDNIILKDYFSSGDEIEVVVLDFDLSWHKGASELSVIEGARAQGYAAPEQTPAGAKRKNASTRSTAVDTFGLGMIAFFCVCARDPRSNEHRFDDFQETLIANLNKSLPLKLKSCSPYIAVKIVEATQDVQADRIGFDSFVDAIREIAGYVSGGEIVPYSSIFINDIASRCVSESRIGHSGNVAKIHSADGTFHISISIRQSASGISPCLAVLIEKNRGHFEDTNWKTTLVQISDRLTSCFQKRGFTGKPSIMQSSVMASAHKGLRDQVSWGDAEALAADVSEMMAAITR